jgi:hypothetical protein
MRPELFHAALQSCELLSAEQSGRRFLQLDAVITERDEQSGELMLQATVLAGRGGHGAG